MKTTREGCPDDDRLQYLGYGSYGCVIRCSASADRVVKLFVSSNPVQSEQEYRTEVEAATKFADAARSSKTIADATASMLEHTASYAINATAVAKAMCPALARSDGVINVPAITYTFAGKPITVDPAVPTERFECVLQYLKKLTSAVEELNAKGVTHGDITYLNVMHHAQRGYVLIDFGYIFPAATDAFWRSYNADSTAVDAWMLWRPWQLYLLTRTPAVQADFDRFWAKMRSNFPNVLPKSLDAAMTYYNNVARAAAYYSSDPQPYIKKHFNEWFTHGVDMYGIAVLALYLASADQHPLSCRMRWAAKYIAPLIARAAAVTGAELQAAFAAGSTITSSIPSPLAVATTFSSSTVTQVYRSVKEASTAADQWGYVDAILRPKKINVVAGAVLEMPNVSELPAKFVSVANVSKMLRAVEAAAADGILIHCYEERCLGFQGSVPVLVNARPFLGPLPWYHERIAAGDLFLPLCCHLHAHAEDSVRNRAHVVAVATELWQRIEVMLDTPVAHLRDAAIAAVLSCPPDASRILSVASLYGVLLHLLPFMEQRHKVAVAEVCLTMPYFTAQNVADALK